MILYPDLVLCVSIKLCSDSLYNIHIVIIILVVLFHIGEKIFRKLFPKLVLCLQPCINSVADHCLSEGLVSEGTYTSILELNMTSADKTRKLLMNIKQTISQDPNAIDKLCCILTEVGGCDSVVKDLRTCDDF